MPRRMNSEELVPAAFTPSGGRYLPEHAALEGTFVCKELRAPTGGFTLEAEGGTLRHDGAPTGPFSVGVQVVSGDALVASAYAADLERGQTVSKVSLWPQTYSQKMTGCRIHVGDEGGWFVEPTPFLSFAGSVEATAQPEP